MMKPLYEIFSGEELKIAEKIQRRRYQMLVHSYIYYEMDENLISDSLWSQWAMELAELQIKYPDIAKAVEYAIDFEDWDGSSGAFLTYVNKPNIISIAFALLRDKNDRPKVITSTKKSSTSKTSTAKKKLF